MTLRLANNRLYFTSGFGRRMDPGASISYAVFTATEGKYQVTASVVMAWRDRRVVIAINPVNANFEESLTRHLQPGETLQDKDGLLSNAQTQQRNNAILRLTSSIHFSSRCCKTNFPTKFHFTIVAICNPRS